MRRADELLPEAPKPKRGRPPKAKAQALANYDAGDVERPAGERWVTMSNALTRAGHGLTLAEKRIVAAAVSKLDSRKALPPGEVPRTKLTAMEYAETFGVDMNTAYDQLQAAAKQLYKRSITFYEPAHKRSGKPLPPTMVQMRWVGSVKYHQRGGLGRTGMVAGSHSAPARPQSAVHDLPATASVRAALGLLVEAAGAADALPVHGHGGIHHRGLLRLDGCHREAGRELRQGANQDHRTRREGTPRERRLADSVAPDQGGPQGQGGALHLHA